jgi:hypothetical protein
MKNKIIILSLIIALTANLTITFAWGNKAHRIINMRAIEMLPEEMDKMKDWKDYIAEHASDPDIRRDNGTDTTEWPKHFIDLDYYPEFLNGEMITDKDKFISIYGEETVTKMGLLPWTTLETFENLKKSFAQKNRDKVLIYASDLGHYVGDGHQPFHTMLNYDGQLSDQKGIHGRYESEMVNKYIDQISNSIMPPEMTYVEEPLDFIFDYLAASNFSSPIILEADKIAYKQIGSHGSSDYYKLMWFRTKKITIEQISNAICVLASLIYTAWIDAGKPSLDELN